MIRSELGRPCPGHGCHRDLRRGPAGIRVPTGQGKAAIWRHRGDPAETSAPHMRFR